MVTTSSGIEPRLGSVGKVVPDLELRLVDPDGTDVLAGDPGEIWVQGPTSSSATGTTPRRPHALLTEDGWLRTGDVAVSDDDGYLWLVDRAKDLIIVSGFNVFPAEVEEVIAELPGVAEVAVVGVSHPHTGEAVKAYVVPETGVHLDEEAVIAHARRTWPATSARPRCCSWTRCPATCPARCSGGSCARRARGSSADRQRCYGDVSHLGARAGRPGVAMRKPQNSTTTPATSVTASAVSFPSRPASVPLADRTRVPSAMTTFPSARRRAVTAGLRAPDDRPRARRHADHARRRHDETAATPEPTAARMRGGSKSSLPSGSSSLGTGARRRP